ncbi:MAG: hypothetical protein ACP5R4_07850 [Armatimonadota bacterium]
MKGQRASAVLAVLASLFAVLAAPVQCTAKQVPRSAIIDLGFDKRDMPKDYQIQRDDIGTLQGTRVQSWFTSKRVEVPAKKEKSTKGPRAPLPQPSRISVPLGTITLSVWVEQNADAASARLKKELDPKLSYRAGGPLGRKIGDQSLVPKNSQNPAVLFRRSNVAVKIETESPKNAVSPALVDKLARTLDAKIRRYL